MTQTLRIPDVQLGNAGATVAVSSATSLTTHFATSSLVSYVDDLVFYEDEIVEY